MMIYVLFLTLHFAEMGGGGDIETHMRFTSEPLCKAFRKAIMSQLQDMKGYIGECQPLDTPADPTPIPPLTLMPPPSLLPES